MEHRKRLSPDPDNAMKRLLLIVALLFPVLAMAGTLQPLAASDVTALLKPPAHGERVIALWALDCAYCEPNLEALAKLQRAHPRDIELVIVTTDSIERRQAIETRLQRMKMDDFPNRAYAEATPERLNFLLDPTWGGETPRVLVIRADGSRLGISGELTPAQLHKIR
jgi:iron complex outermembrane receptor protein